MFQCVLRCSTCLPFPDQNQALIRITHRFGDTFSHDAKDEYIGTTDNTISLARDPSNPSLSTYPDPAYKSDASAIEPFIDCFQEGSKAINKLWSFSGIVITEADVDAEHMLGWTWFEVRHPGATLDDWKYRGMGIVRVIVDSHEGKSRIRTDGRSTVRLSSGVREDAVRVCEPTAYEGTGAGVWQLLCHRSREM